LKIGADEPLLKPPGIAAGPAFANEKVPPAGWGTDCTVAGEPKEKPPVLSTEAGEPKEKPLCCVPCATDGDPKEKDAAGVCCAGAGDPKEKPG
jgi:hypothetical protein